VALNNDFRFSYVTKLNDNLSLLETYPIDGAVDIETDVTIELKFDGPIAGNSLGGNISFVDQDSNAISVSVSSKDYTDGIIRFTPTNSLTENNQYYIYLKDGLATTDGYTFGKHQTISFSTIIITSVEGSNIKNKYELFTAYPNPFNPETTLEFQLNQKSEVWIKVFDIRGKEVVDFEKRKYSAGKHQLQFDASDLPSGIYFSQISARDLTKTIKLILLK
jgi:flagellar hook assembly protein FlgD